MEEEVRRAARACRVRARQTGKSTLLRKLLSEAAVWLDFSRPAERAHEASDLRRAIDAYKFFIPPLPPMAFGKKFSPGVKS